MELPLPPAPLPCTGKAAVNSPAQHFFLFCFLNLMYKLNEVDHFNVLWYVLQKRSGTWFSSYSRQWGQELNAEASKGVGQGHRTRQHRSKGVSSVCRGPSGNPNSWTNVGCNSRNTLLKLAGGLVSKYNSHWKNAQKPNFDLHASQKKRLFSICKELKNDAEHFVQL